jgi:hypothetical protein
LILGVFAIAISRVDRVVLFSQPRGGLSSPGRQLGIEPEVTISMSWDCLVLESLPPGANGKLTGNESRGMTVMGPTVAILRGRRSPVRCNTN